MMKMGFEEKTVATANGERRVLVATPRVRILVGLERLAELRQTVQPGSIDDSLLERVRASKGPVSAVLFRARSDDGAGSWGVDPSLPEPETRELVRRLARSHLVSHRRLLTAGVLAVVHTDYGQREVDLFRQAENELAVEEEKRALASTGSVAAAAQLNMWTLRALSFTYPLPGPKVLAELLPSTIAMLERTVPMVKQMLADAGDQL